MTNQELQELLSKYQGDLPLRIEGDDDRIWDFNVSAMLLYSDKESIEKELPCSILLYRP